MHNPKLNKEKTCRQPFLVVFFLNMIRYSSKGWAWLLICLQLSTHSLAALQHIEVGPRNRCLCPPLTSARDAVSLV